MIWNRGKSPHTVNRIHGKLRHGKSGFHLLKLWWWFCQRDRWIYDITQRQIFVAVERAKSRGTAINKNFKYRGSVAVKFSKNRGNVAAEYKNIMILLALLYHDIASTVEQLSATCVKLITHELYNSNWSSNFPLLGSWALGQALFGRLGNNKFSTDRNRASLWML